jgi:hypothetical protein
MMRPLREKVVLLFGIRTRVALDTGVQATPGPRPETPRAAALPRLDPTTSKQVLGLRCSCGETVPEPYRLDLFRDLF